MQMPDPSFLFYAAFSDAHRRYIHDCMHSTIPSKNSSSEKAAPSNTVPLGLPFSMTLFPVNPSAKPPSWNIP